MASSDIDALCDELKKSTVEDVKEKEKEPEEKEPEKKTQSDGLRQRLKQMNVDGRKLNDDSKVSQSTLENAMPEIIAYAKEKIAPLKGKIIHKKQMTLYECQQYFAKNGGPEPNEANKKVCMKPDGGILVAVLDGVEYPILISEDKVQGTNDSLHEQKKKRQATGNAIERGAKNIRGAEMIFSGMEVFPYALFASGCDFHSSETIAKRIEMMNMGIPNHYIDINTKTTDESLVPIIDTIVDSISLKKVCGRSIASVFVKAHKWNEMKHGSSMWKQADVVLVCCKIVDLMLEEISVKKQDT